MLVLTRKHNERIKIGENIWITIVDVRGNTIRLGIDAPKDVPIRREEVIPGPESRVEGPEPEQKAA